MRILITGNPTREITKAILELYPDADTVSRSPEATYAMDLTITENVQKLAKLSLDYDVFINSALVPDFGQTRILQAVWTEWRAANKSGSIISFGSSVDYYFRPDNRMYPVEKRALHDLNRSLSKHVTWFDSKIRCTYLAFGGVNTEKTMRQWGHYQHLTTQEVAEYVQWVINAPPHVNVDEIHITPIQPKTKREMKKSQTNAPIVWSSGDDRVFLINEE